MASAQVRETLVQDPVAIFVKQAERADRMAFIRKVYSILTAQLLLTVVIAAPFQTMSNRALVDNQWMLVISTFVMCATMCSMWCCNGAKLLRKFPTNYGLMFALTAALGVIVGYTSAMYTWQSVALAAGITTGIFASMTVYAWTTKSDFTGYGPYLFAAIMSLCMFGFTLSILGFCGVHIEWAIMLYNLMGVLLFTFYIVYDTQLIIGAANGQEHKFQFTIDDYCFAALNLYLDIINLFLRLLRLLGERRR